MNLHFRKYQATGNDFVMLDNRANLLTLLPETVAMLCNRRLGIGADGLIMIENHPEANFAMRYFNRDGKEATFCGNGGRAVAAFATALGITGEPLAFVASDGLHHASVLKSAHPEYLVELGMSDVQVENSELIDTGSPHHIVPVSDPVVIDVIREGRRLRNDPRFSPGGCNVNFAGTTEEGIVIRTYERGVEEETLSCGTGATASAIYYSLNAPDGLHTVPVQTRGGKLTLTFLKHGNHFSEIRLTGTATEVYTGNITL